MEKLALRSMSTKTKIIGTIVSISGALVVVLYKGPTVLSSPASTDTASLQVPLGSSQTNWIIGGLLLSADYLLLSFWYVVQTQVMKIYPAELVTVFLYNFCATIIALPVCFMAEKNLSAWRLKPDIALVSIIYAGCTGSSLNTVVHSWGLHTKGPVYVAIFKPLSISIAAITGVIFLGDALYLGSVIGAVIISVGFYAVIWGKAKEEGMTDDTGYTSLAHSDLKSYVD
ncbi:WAT1-related protein [Melia azedarach]|uniref:WAT1-related protein n=1 Tax=Melia azedarach TaxID=155640 RepID=A0ACC1Z197_MELAZ|nr:WAT1-related protein [Melia azedarach]